MAHAETEEGKERGRRDWSKIILACTIVLSAAIVWRTVYVTNQRSLQLRRNEQRRQSTYAAIHEVPSRFAMLGSGGYDEARKSALAAATM
jgi:hypothetical protein